MIHTICNDDDIISIELLKRRNIGNTGLRSEYFVRRIVMPATEYDEEIPRSEWYITVIVMYDSFHHHHHHALHFTNQQLPRHGSAVPDSVGLFRTRISTPNVISPCCLLIDHRMAVCSLFQIGGLFSSFALAFLFFYF